LSLGTRSLDWAYTVLECLMAGALREYVLAERTIDADLWRWEEALRAL
jgi:hypothetical protein